MSANNREPMAFIHIDVYDKGNGQADVITNAKVPRLDIALMLIRLMAEHQKGMSEKALTAIGGGLNKEKAPEVGYIA